MTYGTMAILKALPGMTGGRRLPRAHQAARWGCSGCRLAVGCAGACWGAEEGWGSYLADLADGAAERASRALQWAQSLPGAYASQAAGYVRGELLAAEADFLDGAARARNWGLEAAAGAFDVLASRARSAIGNLGAGFGEAFRAFWGIDPASLVGGAALLAAGVYLAIALSPGGQASIGAIGSGFGAATSSLGAGYGAGIRGIGEGGGRALVGLTRVLP